MFSYRWHQCNIMQCNTLLLQLLKGSLKTLCGPMYWKNYMNSFSARGCQCLTVNTLLLNAAGYAILFICKVWPAVLTQLQMAVKPPASLCFLLLSETAWKESGASLRRSLHAEICFLNWHLFYEAVNLTASQDFCPVFVSRVSLSLSLLRYTLKTGLKTTTACLPNVCRCFHGEQVISLSSLSTKQIA